MDTEPGPPKDKNAKKKGTEESIDFPENDLRNKRFWRAIAFGQFTAGSSSSESLKGFKRIGLDISPRKVQRWFKDFKEGNLSPLHSKKIRGRKVTADHEERVQKVKELIEADPYISYREIEGRTNVCTGSVTRILRIDLKLEKYNNLWIPVGLSKPEKDARVKRFEKLYPPKPKEKKTRRRRTVQPSNDHDPMTVDNFVT